MIQIKKKFLPLIFIGIFLFTPIKTYSMEEKQSDVVNQKSVIEEQLIVRTRNEDVITNPYFVITENLTEEEIELICRITWLEAGNQPEEGQRAVVEVILNRLKSKDWPNSIETVLSSPRQFTTWKNRKIVTKKQVDEMRKIYDLVINEPIILDDIEYVYFNNSPHKSKDTINIKGHWFWK